MSAKETHRVFPGFFLGSVSLRFGFQKHNPKKPYSITPLLHYRVITLLPGCAELVGGQ